jgi:hypothetical protein
LAEAYLEELVESEERSLLLEEDEEEEGSDSEDSSDSSEESDGSD